MLRPAEIYVTALMSLTYMAALGSYGIGEHAFDAAPPFSHDVWMGLSLVIMLVWCGLVVLCFRRSKWLGAGVLASAYFPIAMISIFLQPVVGYCTFANACP